MNKGSKLRSLRGGTGPFNILSVTIYLLIIAGIYLGWKYVPVYLQKENLSSTVGQMILNARRSDAFQIREAIVETAKTDFKLELNPETVFVNKTRNFIEVEIFYDVTVEHPFDVFTVHKMHVLEKRSIIDW